MPFIIDAHQDLAYNHLSYQRDHRRSVRETRQRESGTPIPEETGHTILGWEEYQRGQVALLFGTLFIIPGEVNLPTFSKTMPIYRNSEEASRFYQSEIDYYNRLDQSSEDMFHLVRSRSEFKKVLLPWQNQPASYPDITHPVGILMSIEGLEGIEKIQDIDLYWDLGVRAIGPVWAGGRFCGGTIHPGGFTSEGYDLLKAMGRRGYILDLAHMNDLSARQALDCYEGPLIASHVNARALLGIESGERHFTDQTIRDLAKRGSVMGIVPLNQYLKTGWKKEDGAHQVTLERVIAQIDHICQITGSVRHVGLGTDADGGYGLGFVPEGINTIADFQKLAPLLKTAGYSDEDIDCIFNKNWQNILEDNLPV